MNKRKIIQITAIPTGSVDLGSNVRYNQSTLYALCDDGSVWEFYGLRDSRKWEQVNIDVVTEIKNDTGKFKRICSTKISRMYE